MRSGVGKKLEKVDILRLNKEQILFILGRVTSEDQDLLIKAAVEIDATFMTLDKSKVPARLNHKLTILTDQLDAKKKA